MNLLLLIVSMIGVLVIIWFIDRFMDYIQDYQAESCYRRRRNYRLRMKLRRYKKTKRRKN